MSETSNAPLAAPAPQDQVHGAWTPDGATTPPTRVSEDGVIAVIKTVFDPEIPVDIYELGLIYAIEIGDDGKVKVEMTLTSPACPSAQQLPSEVRYKVKALEGVSDAFVEVVWEPAWTKDLMSEDAKIGLGMF